METILTDAITLFCGSFVEVLNRSLVAGCMVLLILLLRFVLKKSPKWVNCLLWALVALELMVPLKLTSPLSIYNATPLQSSVVQKNDTTSAVEFFHYSDTPEKPQLTVDLPASKTYPDNRPDLPQAVHTSKVYLPHFVGIWLVGIGFFALYGVTSYNRLRKQTAASLQRSDGLWFCDDIDTPFILGVIRPKIFVPSALESPVLDYVVEHEKAHLRRRDHWWKPLGFVLLAVNWFNPLLWVGYVTLCKDIELACDEKVCQGLDSSRRKAYAESLLLCSIPRGVAIAACPLAFGEVGVKERVRSVARYKKPAFWIILLGVLACIVTALMFLTAPSKNGGFHPFVKQIERHGWDFDLMIKGSPNFGSLSEEYGVTRVSTDYQDTYPNATVSNYHLYAKNGQFTIWDWEDTPRVFATGTYKKDWFNVGDTECYDLYYSNGSTGRATLGKITYYSEDARRIAEQAGVELNPWDESRPKEGWSLYLTTSFSSDYETYHFMNNEESVTEIPVTSDVSIHPAMGSEAVRNYHAKGNTPPEYCYGVGFHYLSHGDVNTKRAFADGTYEKTIYGMTYVAKYSPEPNQNGEIQAQTPYLYYGPVAITARLNDKNEWVVVEYHEKEDAVSYRRYFPREIRQMVDRFENRSQLVNSAREDALSQFALQEQGAFLPEVKDEYFVSSDTVPETNIRFLKQNVDDPYCRSTLLYPVFSSSNKEWSDFLFEKLTRPLSEYYMSCPMNKDNRLSSAIIQDQIFTEDMAWGTMGDYFWFRLDFQHRPFGCPDEEDWTHTNIRVLDPVEQKVVTVGDLFPDVSPDKLEQALTASLKETLQKEGIPMPVPPEGTLREMTYFIPDEKGITLFFDKWFSPEPTLSVYLTWLEIGYPNVFGLLPYPLQHPAQ